MGLLAKIVQKVAPVAAKFGGFIPGIGPVVQKAGALLSKLPVKKVAGVVGAGAAFGAAEQYAAGRVGTRQQQASLRAQGFDKYGRPIKRSRGRKGLTGRDILGAQKVARLVHAFGYKPKIKPRKAGKGCR